jgi:hypothetical protein
MEDGNNKTEGTLLNENPEDFHNYLKNLTDSYGKPNDSNVLHQNITSSFNKKTQGNPYDILEEKK